MNDKEVINNKTDAPRSSSSSSSSSRDDGRELSSYELQKQTTLRTEELVFFHL